MPRPQDSRINGLAELQPRRILCCQLRQIGDVLMLTPSLEMLHKRFPDAEIDVYTEQKCAPVLENNPDIHHIWALERGKSLLHDLRFYHQVGTGGGKRYDIVIDFQQLPRIRWALAFSDARVRFSYPPPWYNRPFYTHWAPVSGPYAAKSKAGILMNGFGMQWENLRPRLYLTAAEHDTARAELAAWGLKPTETLITVDPSHRRITRRWPAGHYGRLLALIAAQRPNLRFLMLFRPRRGGPCRGNARPGRGRRAAQGLHHPAAAPYLPARNGRHAGRGHPARGQLLLAPALRRGRGHPQLHRARLHQHRLDLPRPRA